MSCVDQVNLVVFNALFIFNVISYRNDKKKKL